MRIVDNVRPDRQTVMFSATFPRAMEALARRILAKPLEVQVGGRSVVCSDVEQHVLVIEEDKKFLKLLEILGHYQEKGSVIIFVDKQEHADDLLKDLMKASYPCMSLHGGIDQYDRDSVINDFKNGACRLMVATSVAARGLDVKQLILVVNYNCPNHYEDYVHRAGRTGRAGNKGFAYTFITDDQVRYSGDIIKALELSCSPVPPELEKLWAGYKDQQKAEGKVIKSSSSGFSGKGFKFDETEHAMANERKKLQKAALGLQDSDDEEGAMDEKMMRQVTTGDFCMNSRPSCLAEDGRHPASHFDLCAQANKFYPPPPPSALQMTLAPMALPAQVHKPLACQRQEALAGAPGGKTSKGPKDDAGGGKKKSGKAGGKPGRRGRPLGTTKLAGYRTSTGRPLGTTRAAGFKTSPGRPLGTTRAAGYKVSPGRPPGSIKGLSSRINKLAYGSGCSGAAFPYPLPHKEILCEPSCKEKAANE
ncbi:putative ATP-dependent RNA helicase DDX46 [Liparis tanakae]|uniref:Putative ATP-dependent RNA helicase DDX46 n=1 Tax=Liparis tanakae TaxID=230148 RepID=A0A4Z2FER4_9TELE|nr:putative ATP-dependent RNA helicase DDX46 [Liparis tanakae]